MKAFNDLKREIQKDPAYAYGWHANIAMSCYDSFIESAEGKISGDKVMELSNEAASRFMKLCFDVETSQDMLDRG